MKDSTHIGDTSTAHILAKLLDNGYKVLLPFGENCRYDLAIDLGNKFIRIQCKTGKLINDTIRFQTFTVSRCPNSERADKKWLTKSYDATEIDAYMIYSPNLNKIYIAPIGNKYHMYLRVKKSKKNVKVCNSNKATIKMAEDYEFTGKVPEWLKGIGC